MLQFFNYLFALKTFILIVLIEQIKHHNEALGLESDITLINEVILAIVWPGVFGLIIAIILLAMNLAHLIEGKK